MLGRTKRLLSSQSYITTRSLRPISSSWRQAPSGSLPAIFFQLNTCGHSHYVTFSPMRRGSVVYNCCWALPAQSFSGPRTAGLTTTAYCLRFETPPTWRARSPYSYPPGIGWPGYTPRHWVLILSPPTTRSATAEVCDPVSTRDHWTATVRKN
jgi:hypothetical protein